MNAPVNLSVRNISWSVPRTNQTILHPISFDLKAGRVLGIVGPNGSGKSTLLRLLYRYHQPTSGSILLDRQDIWSQSAQEVACNVAAVLQEHPSDFALTVGQIVALGRTPHRKWFGSTNGKRDNQIIELALKRLGLHAFIERPLNTLSGGERQRVMVARALAQEPRLLILDEPTNHLDVRQQLEVLALIRDLPITIVTSLHDLNMAAEVCNEILMLKDGKSLGFGKPDSILSEDIIAKAFNVGTRLELLNSSNSSHITFYL
tara:strand:+ start:506 stop:1288 length:783 start_codon:yes stop_codon:yes gene_type:complete